MGGRTWTTDEDEILRSIWSGSVTLKLSMHLLTDRTLDAARLRMSVLKLGRRGGRARSHYRWTESEIDAALAKGRPLTAKQLSECTNVSLTRARQILKEHQGTRYHIAGWLRESDRGVFSPRWALGDDEDVPRPKRESAAVISVRFRQRKKARKGMGNPFHGMLSQLGAAA